MRHGLKARAERIAAAARKALGLGETAPLDPWLYARHRKLHVLDLADLKLPREAAQQLLVADTESWSAMTLKEGATIVIIVNPTHAITRQRSNLMHEIAHIELEHMPNRVEVSNTGLLLLSDYSDDQELEADWLGAALLLPRGALMRSRRQGRPSAEIASMYGVSQALCDWRLRTTGVEVQIRRLGMRLS